jgi:radical SAM protein with 4Fe4S-binding SPASM domain
MKKFSKVLLELQSSCDRNCWFCPRFSDRSGNRKDKNGNPIKQQFLPTDKVYDILNQLVKLHFAGPIAFHHMSEPTLDNRLIDIATDAKSMGMRPFMHTNGDRLKDNPELCKSIDSIFHRVCVGLYDYKNQKQLNTQKKFWRKKFKNTKLTFSCRGQSSYFKVRPNMDMSQIDESDAKIKKKLDSACNQPCFESSKRLIIHYDGNVAMCCEDMKAEFGLGNVFNESIEQIWWSKKHIEICRNLKRSKGRKLYSLCSGCKNVKKMLKFKKKNTK